ncbi:MAG: hypothetical protein Q7V01_03450 [Vicinamibacterales bacterium]|nr:hypothetical protein [Vicinamibacterales bacterium]
MARRSFHTLDAAQTLEHVVMQLAAARPSGRRVRLPRVFTEADIDAVRVMPTWVARVGVLRSRGAWWLWCEPRKGARPTGGQFVIDVPAGRYTVDILDTRTHAWCSRESAAAAPLVAGLPVTGGAVLVRLRRVSSVTDRPVE